MSSAHAEHKIILTMSPKELRDLADKMERMWPTMIPGQSTFVDVIQFAVESRGIPQINIHLDQVYFHKLNADKKGT